MELIGFVTQVKSSSVITGEKLVKHYNNVQEGTGAALCGHSGGGAAAAGHGPGPAPSGLPHPEAAAAQLLPRFVCVSVCLSVCQCMALDLPLVAYRICPATSQICLSVCLPVCQCMILDLPLAAYRI